MELTAERVYEMRGTGQITKDGIEHPRTIRMDPDFGVVTLRDGAYLIDIAEDVEIGEDQTGIIRSLDSLGSVGAFVYPLTIGEGSYRELQIGLFCSRSVELELNAPIASLSIEDSLDVEALEGDIDEKITTIARYLKHNGVNEMP